MKVLTGWGEVKSVKPHKPDTVEAAVLRAIEFADAQHPPYRAAVEKLERVLKPRLRELDRRREELLRGLGRQTVDDDLTNRARALLAGEDASLAQDERRARIHRDLESLGDEERVLRRAIEEHQKVIQHERELWSKLVCDQLDGVYRAQVKKIAEGLQLLGEADLQHAQLFNALRDHEVSAGFRPMFFRLAGHGDLTRTDLTHSAAWWWFKDAREHGLLPE
jgi:hypothetical protein